MTQLTLLDSLSQSTPRDEGIKKVIDHNSEFVAQMRIVARQICVELGTVSTDEVRRYADTHGIIPPHFKAWSVIFRGKDWQFVEWRQSTIESNHARRIAVYRYKNQ